MSEHQEVEKQLKSLREMKDESFDILHDSIDAKNQIKTIKNNINRSAKLLKEIKEMI